MREIVSRSSPAAVGVFTMAFIGTTSVGCITGQDSWATDRLCSKHYAGGARSGSLATGRNLVVLIVTAQARREDNIQMIRRFCCSGTETSLCAGPHTPSPVEFDPDQGRPASENAVPQEVAHLAVLSIGGSQHNKTKNQ